MQIEHFEPRFTSRIPEHLEDGILYISTDCNAVIHKCACGCGEEVSTPLGKRGWKLLYDGERVSLSPSIGNFSYPCRSHYFIRENNVIWAEAPKRKWWQFWKHRGHHFS